MIQANELRIGNLIYWNIPEKQDVIHTVVGIRNNKPQTIPISLGESNEEYNPIRLTVKWALKFGFKPLPFKNILNSLTKDIGRNRILSIGNIGTANEMIWICEVNPTDPKVIDDLICIHNYDYDKEIFIHKLQNLYHVLTGEELTINETSL